MIVGRFSNEFEGSAAFFLSYDTAEQSHVCGRTEAALLALKIKGLTPACGRPRAAPEDPATLDSCGFGVARRRQPAQLRARCATGEPQGSAGNRPAQGP